MASWVSETGYDLMGKSDSRFMEGVYKFVRAQFNYNPSLTLPQFFTVGFAERKLIFVSELIQMTKEKHKELKKSQDSKRRAPM